MYNANKDRIFKPGQLLRCTFAGNYCRVNSVNENVAIIVDKKMPRKSIEYNDKVTFLKYENNLSKIYGFLYFESALILASMSFFDYLKDKNNEN